MRVRFAPSPTGYLHVGGARTAIFNWLWAKKHGGAFILRIEDTDRDRSRAEHTQAILDGLGWLGLDWDEGPFFQSDGVARHRDQALRMLEEGYAYRDFTDPAEVRAEAEDRGMHPSRVAREKAEAMGIAEAQRRADSGERHAVRFRVPDGETRFLDMVHGETRFGHDDVDDLVILRSDGTPVYNLAVVSDDAEMGITHVIRGDDHLSNTPKQILLYRALGFPEPVFGHVPLILGADGKRLSKRNGATALRDYARGGIVPEAMLNFLALLGWSPGDDREIMDRTELIEAFDMDRVLKKSAVFDVEKLDWLNGRHLAARPTPELIGELRERVGGWDGLREDLRNDDDWMAELTNLLKQRARNLDDLAEQARPFLSDELIRDDQAVAKHWAKNPDTATKHLMRLLESWREVDWQVGPLEDSLRALSTEMGVGAGKLIHPLRVALTGRTASPGIFDVLVLLGRERSTGRVGDALERLRTL